ncbi:MAG: hypothetical protein WC628_07235 [Candidatus Omnitrophota bacterium]
MKVDKSLQEVWDWKDKVYQETKHLTMKEAVENIRKGAEDFCKKYNLSFKTLHLLQK